MISIIVEGGLLTISHHIEGFRGLKYLITYSWVDESFFLVVGEGQIGMRVPCKGVTKKRAKELINQHIPRLQAKRKSIGAGGARIKHLQGSSISLQEEAPKEISRILGYEPAVPLEESNHILKSKEISFTGEVDERIIVLLFLLLILLSLLIQSLQALYRIVLVVVQALVEAMQQLQLPDLQPH